MTLNWDETGYAFDVINFDWDGNEIHTGAIDPIDITHVRCTYVQSLPRNAVNASRITTVTFAPAVGRIVRYEPTLSRTGSP